MMTHRSATGIRGFTLIELLVVVAIVSVFLTMTAVVSNDAIDLNNATRSRVVSERNAAAFMRQFEADLTQRITRDEARMRIGKREGNDRITMLAQRQGYALQSSAADRRVSLAGYRIRGNRLERAAGGYGFGSAQERPAAQAGTLSLKEIGADGPDEPADNAYQVICPAVIRLELSFLVRDGQNRVLRAEAPQDQGRIEAVIATLVSLDPDRARMLDESRIESIAAEFPDAVNNETPVEKWTGVADTLSEKLPQIPKTVLQKVRVHQGMFTLPQRNSIP
jgi:prepilin-type N-terminal cleavage/methylation domain-containing protein